MDTLKKTPLHSSHIKHQAKMVPFAGYDMPVQYSKGLMHEHQAVRTHAGLFDVSHMGILELKGSRTQDFLNFALTRDISKLQSGKAAYSLLCYEDGGTVDDLIVYCVQNSHFYIVLNASNKEKDLKFLKSLTQMAPWNKESFTWNPLFDSYGLLALQGPKSLEILKLAGWTNPDPTSMNPKPFSFFPNQKLYKEVNVHLAFTGYTGEVGCEIFCENSQIEYLWNHLLKSGGPLGLEPIGLGARDTLRTEMGYSLYGHELSETINPIEAGLSWAVGLKKESFFGKSALASAASHPKRKLVSLRDTTSKRAARGEMKVLNNSGQEVGIVTSGTYSPTLGYSVAMALVHHDAQPPFFIDIRGQKVPYEICDRPFLKK